ncbi:MAG: hypothetical protein ABSB59_27450 [Streptosporangiaceae bacterium]
MIYETPANRRRPPAPAPSPVSLRSSASCGAAGRALLLALLGAEHDQGTS